MKQIKKLIFSGEFSKAKEILDQINEDERLDLLMDLSLESESIAIYGLIISILLENETAHWHYTAGLLLLAALCDIEGAYPTGAYHMRRAAELEPSNIEFKKGILAFHHLPEPVVGKDEAISVAKEIIATDSTIKKAIGILEDYGIKP